MKFGLTDSEFHFLQVNVIDPLKAHGARVYIFGSRAVGNQQKFSDIDLLFEDLRGNISNDFLFELKSKLEESSFPFKIDLINKAELAQSYILFVEKQKIEV